ncbi:hypothetical protein ACP70R_034862 [Stipagrostis hirtigluma subsp. patula]
MERGSAADHRGKKALMGNGEEENEGQMGKKEKRKRKEKKERRDKGGGSDGDGSFSKHSIENEQAEASVEKALMGNLEEGNEGEMGKKEKSKRKDKKERRGKYHGSDGDGSFRKRSVENEQAEASADMSENLYLEHAEGGMSKSDAKKDRNKNKKNKEIETTCKQHVLDAAGENVGSEHSERKKGEGEHDSKSKKGKRKRQDCATASDGSAGDQIVSREDKKGRKEHSVTLEEGKQIDMSKMEEKREGKKKRRKGSDNVGQDIIQNIRDGGDGKNSMKENKKSKDDNDGGEREKVAHRKDKGKRVSFTDAVEVFSIDGNNEEGDGSGDSRLVHGQRFTPEEDAILMEAIKNYAEMKQLGEKGVEMIRDSIKHPETRGCWADIATSLPHRPVTAVYNRARILLHRSAERKWTQEEYEMVRRSVEKNGTNWKKLATELGKSNIHVKDTWRRIKHTNLNKGAWTQDEYQNLFDLVNLDLRVKAHQKIDPGHRMLRDNISWEAISDKLTTRNNKDCCLKWYQQLTSPLVKQGIWADIDDYLLVEALQKVDAVCIEDIDWESLLDHRVWGGLPSTMEPDGAHDRWPPGEAFH